MGPFYSHALRRIGSRSPSPEGQPQRATISPERRDELSRSSCFPTTSADHADLADFLRSAERYGYAQLEPGMQAQGLIDATHRIVAGWLKREGSDPATDRRLAQVVSSVVRLVGDVLAEYARDPARQEVSRHALMINGGVQQQAGSFRRSMFFVRSYLRGFPFTRGIVSSGLTLVGGLGAVALGTWSMVWLPLAVGMVALMVFGYSLTDGFIRHREIVERVRRFHGECHLRYEVFRTADQELQNIYRRETRPEARTTLLSTVAARYHRLASEIVYKMHL